MNLMLFVVAAVEVHTHNIEFQLFQTMAFLFTEWSVYRVPNIRAFMYKVYASLEAF